MCRSYYRTVVVLPDCGTHLNLFNFWNHPRISLEPSLSHRNLFKPPETLSGFQRCLSTSINSGESYLTPPKASLQSSEAPKEPLCYKLGYKRCQASSEFMWNPHYLYLNPPEAFWTTLNSPDLHTLKSHDLSLKPSWKLHGSLLPSENLGNLWPPLKPPWAFWASCKFVWNHLKLTVVSKTHWKPCGVLWKLLKPSEIPLNLT